MLSMPRFAVAASLMAAAGSVLAYDDEVCGSGGYHSDGNAYAFYPNAWDPEDGGFTCMGINQDPPEFDVTWRWTETPDSVNSYPHVKFQNTNVPSSIGNITSLRLKTSWGLGGPDEDFPVEGIQASDINAIDLRCNVGWDMFGASDLEASQAEVNATTEIMIWLGLFGKPWPLGYSKEPKYPAQTLGGVDFNLYDGMNERGQTVLTWVAAENVTEFDAEVLPLIEYLLDNDFVDGDDILGLVEFGSEAFYATDNVTFSAYNMEVTLETDDPEDKYPFSGGDDGDDGSDDDNAGVSAARLSLGLVFGAFISAASFLL
ncbi:putative Glycoside Hydrolase Family 12 [Zalerion maritima]|uniref:Glycoside Hydrolase Family 12 n=1 Tax=Zalerion maritima TaxID=339359 RepID=A0AAD5RMM3_9PEZI|nr:putative Glycoside Hydrolase Family 12 [Zalerion maritima]